VKELFSLSFTVHVTDSTSALNTRDGDNSFTECPPNARLSVPIISLNFYTSSKGDAVLFLFLQVSKLRHREVN
jgi:hypothetical protein